ncbi:adenosylcobyric acid synthase [Methanomicrobium sp. W14]|uniref:cobyric acid synthase n=1 Tax=Methanomicrobium sp. W14 TaxID=2817839 RepID=UPI001AE7372B|nr:cobyric acid synthase [Methanomicrobium sp. W14]MBP2132842.1 adenosylcobyric acid synthase [Methanomicrobium sp. W14]
MSLMILGTSSHAGKSTITAAVCRSMSKRNISVAPFKSQNMSLNSYVTKDGAEIGIAQAMQAFAAMTEPQAEMNPILLKPKGDKTSQIVLLGKPYKDVCIGDYYKETPCLLDIAAEAYEKLRKKYKNVVVEGAGSAAEVNLYDRDIANILLAERINIPIIIVGDIERGGIFAQIIGTYDLLPKDVRKNVVGFIINKFRGDKDLFKDGIRIIEEKTGLSVLGVLPYIDIPIPSEDSLSINDKTASDSPVKIAIVRLPRISNFSDFEILEKFASVEYTEPHKSLEKYDCIIIPGTKNTVEDFEELQKSGFGEELKKARMRKVPVIGVCGGYQMLGKKIRDEGFESGEKKVLDGFGLLNIETVFDSYSKTTVQVKRKANAVGPILSSVGETEGYEIHMGRTILNGTEEAFSGDGAVSEDGLVIGTYMHGLFKNVNFSDALLKYLYSKKNLPFNGINDENPDESYDMLSEYFEKHVNFDKILQYFEN